MEGALQGFGYDNVVYQSEKCCNPQLQQHIL